MDKEFYTPEMPTEYNASFKSKKSILKVCENIMDEAIKKNLEQAMEVPDPKHTKLNLKGTISGRLSSRKPNSANPPRSNINLVVSRKNEGTILKEGNNVIVAKNDYKKLKKQIESCKENWRNNE